MNTTPVPNFVYSILKKHESCIKKQQLNQIIKRKERSIKYIESPIVRNRIKNEMKSIRQKINEIDNQINLYK